MKKVFFSICCTTFSFILFIMGLMNMFPLFIATLLLFLSIFFSVFFFNERHRFKGIHH
nr:hypothetical protein [Salibacterium salarium]